MSLVAEDQVNHPVHANIRSYPSSPDGGFSGGQQIQRVEGNCTNIIFNVYSPFNSEKVNLYADGPCGGSIPSTRQLDIQFNICNCPVGFEHLSSEIKCECICDFKLSPYTLLTATQQLIHL